jgi:hypothetical protein
MLRTGTGALLVIALTQIGCSSPASTALSPSVGTSFVTAFHQSHQVAGQTIRPTKLLEDSRCPLNVNCVQAGTVRLQVTIAERGHRRKAEVALGVPLALAGTWLHLAAVCPHPSTDRRLSLSEYRFYFLPSYRETAPLAEVSCNT